MSHVSAIIALIVLALGSPTQSAFCPKATSWKNVEVGLGMRPSRLAPALQSKSEPEEGYRVEVTYEGRTTSLMVEPHETILSALERTQTADRLCIPSFPHECRRGNCLTCTGKHQEGSVESSLEHGEDGLAPHLSRELRVAGFVLTCSSFVAGEGLKIDLGRNDEVWKAVYSERLRGEKVEDIARQAQARQLRLIAEENILDWQRETEEALGNSAE